MSPWSFKQTEQWQKGYGSEGVQRQKVNSTEEES